MGKRRTGRKLAMHILYQCSLRKDDIDTVIAHFFDERNFKEETKTWANELAQSTWGHLNDIDALISKYAIDWDIDRINIVDKSILRLAFNELLYTETSKNIVLNEAIELSKKYSTNESPKFINGILGNYVKEQCSPD